MPHLVDTTLFMDGDSLVILHVFIQGDGVSLELKNYVLLDPHTELTPFMPQQQDLIVKRVWYEMNGFSGTLLFNSTTPWAFWTLTPQSGVEHDWSFFGGIRDHSDMESRDGDSMGIDSDGKLMITTKGLSQTTGSAAMVFLLEKRNRPNPQDD